ncbi:creatininase family protein [Nitratireductor basaltis]|uniref:Creatininase n=1 Tax=Nitratireductor basaltis TaxID=472175 RepID=A0A084U7X3_9HYPH|nr:creatininase family protein [Nitratireductor basaltis]KFB09059.1 Creatininase [Nitratireductor basaltis]
MPQALQIAVLPLGATEQHGPHLPPETDWIIAEAMVERLRTRVSQSVDLQLLPVEKVGYSIEHGAVGGTKSLGYHDAIERWIGIGKELCDKGVRRLVLLNAHGGNSPLMTVVTTELRARHKMLAVATSWTRFGYPDAYVSAQEKAIGIHGGFIETSVMLALRPDLVRMEAAEDFPSRQTEFVENFQHLRAYGPHAFGWMMRDLSKAGVTGNAAAATPEAGKAIIEHSLNGLAELVEDVARFDLSIFDV